MSSYPSDDEVIDIEECEPHPWSQHEEESDKNYKAFCAYRDLGRDRTKLQAYLNYSGKTREEWGKDSATSQFYAWSKKFAWNERVKKWDEHMDEKRAEKYEEEMMDYYEDVIDYAKSSSTHLLEALDARFKNKDPEEKADLVFGDQSMDLEAFARCFTQLNNIADKAFGSFTENDEDDSGGGILEEIEEAVKDD